MIDGSKLTQPQAVEPSHDPDDMFQWVELLPENCLETGFFPAIPPRQPAGRWADGRLSILDFA